MSIGEVLDKKNEEEGEKGGEGRRGGKRTSNSHEKPFTPFFQPPFPAYVRRFCHSPQQKH